jgi:hypothetical protein
VGIQTQKVAGSLGGFWATFQKKRAKRRKISHQTAKFRPIWSRGFSAKLKPNPNNLQLLIADPETLPIVETSASSPTRPKLFRPTLEPSIQEE